MSKGGKQSGFTIVELLIVIVVIGILAAITLIAYNGIQNRAKVASLQSDLDNATRTLENYKFTNAATAGGEYYPNAATFATTVKSSSGTTYSYLTDTLTNPTNYCLTAANGSFSYSITSKGGGVLQGTCTTNTAAAPQAPYAFSGTFAANPNGFTWMNTRWFGGGSPSAGTHTVLTGPTPVGNSYIHKTWGSPTAPTSNGDSGFDTAYKLAVQANEVYSISAYLRPSSIKNGEVGVYQYDSTQAAFSTARVYGTTTLMPANTWTKISIIYSVPAGVSYIAVAADIHSSNAGGASVWTVGETLDGTGLMVAKSPNSVLFNYADGDSPNWFWNGTPGNSSSTGIGTSS